MMVQNIARTRLVLWVSFIIALIFQSIPWPGHLEMIRPTWLILVCCYWIVALPYRVNVGTALILGLIWDLIIGSTLGIHGVVMSVIAYIIAVYCQMLRNMALWQQAAVIGLVSVIGELLEFFCEFIINDVDFNPHLLWVGLVNFVLWPWMFLLLRKVRRHWNMN